MKFPVVFTVVFCLAGALPVWGQKAAQPLPSPGGTIPVATPIASPALPSSLFDNIPVATPITPVATPTVPHSTTTNGIFLGDYVVSKSQELLSRDKARINFVNKPLSDVVRLLAEAAGINYVMPQPKADNDKINLNVYMNPFQALQSIAGNFGMGVYEEALTEGGGDSIWFIRPKDKELLIARSYKLENIHLGESGGGDVNKGFGGGNTFDNNNNGGNNNNNNYNGNYNTTGAANTLDNNTANFGNGGGNNSDPILNQTGDKKAQIGSEVITTIRNILGIAEDNALESEDQKNVITSSTIGNESRTKKVTTFVSYNGENNTLFVIASKRQQDWVQSYLTAVDKSFNDISIEALFLESSVAPSQKIGLDWSGLNDFGLYATGAGSSGTSTNTNSTTSGTSTGTNSTSTQSTGTAINISNLGSVGVFQTDALRVGLSAIISDQRSRVARFPRVITANNQEVIIRTTQDIPISSIQQEVNNNNASGQNVSNNNSLTGTSIDGGTSINGSTGGGTTINTNNGTTVGQTLGVQSIGTTIRIKPQQINDVMVLLNITVEISTEDNSGQGEQTSGRVSTQSTVYQGVVKVPSGYTLAIAGLERIAESSGIARVPWLSEIPVFGFFFKEKSKDFNRTNITMFVTPTILSDAALLGHGSQGFSHPFLKPPQAVYDQTKEPLPAFDGSDDKHPRSATANATNTSTNPNATPNP